jgi:hypothetical protein
MLSWLPVLAVLAVAQLPAWTGRGSMGDVSAAIAANQVSEAGLIGADETMRPRPREQSAAGVSATTDGPIYHSGQAIVVTISNHLSDAIYLLAGQASHPTVAMQRLGDDEWTSVGSNAAEGPPGFLVLRSSGETSFTLAAVRSDSGTDSPIVSGPSAPGAFEGDVRTLPTVLPWQPGDPIREVPRGPSRPAETLCFSAGERAFSPGMYRIEVQFTMEALSDAWQTIYSDEFIIE